MALRLEGDLHGCHIVLALCGETLHVFGVISLFGIYSQTTYESLLHQRLSDYASHVAAAKQQSI